MGRGDARVLRIVELALYDGAINGQPGLRKVVAKYHGALDEPRRKAALARLAGTFFDAGKYTKAGDLYIEAGIRQKAVACARKLEEGRRFSKAAILYEKLGMKEEAASAYEQAGTTFDNYCNAARLREKGLGQQMAAARLYVKTSKARIPRSLYEIKQPTYDDIRDPHTIERRICKIRGKAVLEAVRLYDALGMGEESAKILVESGIPDLRRKGAERLYKSGRIREAAGILESIGSADFGGAVDMHRWNPDYIGDTRRAAKMYDETGMREKARELRQSADNEDARVQKDAEHLAGCGL